MTRTKSIATLNDEFRKHPAGHGKIVYSRGVQSRGLVFIAKCLRMIAAFNAFTPENNPSGERNIIGLEVDDVWVIFQIEYRAVGEEGSSPDPSDPAVTIRVGTLMLDTEFDTEPP